MDKIAMYAPFIGSALAIFGIVRVLMRSGVEFGNRGMTSFQPEKQQQKDRDAVFAALFSPSSRFDLYVMILGVFIILMFIAWASYYV